MPKKLSKRRTKNSKNKSKEEEQQEDDQQVEEDQDFDKEDMQLDQFQENQDNYDFKEENQNQIQLVAQQQNEIEEENNKVEIEGLIQEEQFQSPKISALDKIKRYLNLDDQKENNLNEDYQQDQMGDQKNELDLVVMAKEQFQSVKNLFIKKEDEKVYQDSDQQFKLRQEEQQQIDQIKNQEQQDQDKPKSHRILNFEIESAYEIAQQKVKDIIQSAKQGIFNSGQIEYENDEDEQIIEKNNKKQQNKIKSQNEKKNDQANNTISQPNFNQIIPNNIFPETMTQSYHIDEDDETYIPRSVSETQQIEKKSSGEKIQNKQTDSSEKQKKESTQLPKSKQNSNEKNLGQYQQKLEKQVLADEKNRKLALLKQKEQKGQLGESKIDLAYQYVKEYQFFMKNIQEINITLNESLPLQKIDEKDNINFIKKKQVMVDDQYVFQVQKTPKHSHSIWEFISNKSKRYLHIRGQYFYTLSKTSNNLYQVRSIKMLQSLFKIFVFKENKLIRLLFLNKQLSLLQPPIEKDLQMDEIERIKFIKHLNQALNNIQYQFEYIY